MRSYKKADGRTQGSVRRTLRAQAALPPERIGPDDLAALERQAERALARNKALLEMPESDRGYRDGLRSNPTLRSPSQARRGGRYS